MLLWRIICRKLPIRGVTSRWGKGSPMCPRCHVRTESLRHALWDCNCVQPWWRKCSNMLEAAGVTEKITWKQAILGARGRLNPAIYKIWQYIRAIIISKIWQDRNLLAHQRPGLNLDSSHVKIWIMEACILAKEKEKLRLQVSILIRKISKILGNTMGVMYQMIFDI